MLNTPIKPELLEVFKNIELSIQTKFTGKISFEINLNQGGIGQISMKSEQNLRKNIPYQRQFYLYFK